MDDLRHGLSLVVATKDRPDDLKRLLDSMQMQTARPDQIVVVDASADPVEHIAREFPGLDIKYIRYDLPPSASAQRNAGVRAVAPDVPLVGFIDDDTTFEPDSIEAMLRFWDTASEDVAGAAFNIRNYQLPPGRFLKCTRLASWLGLYSPRMGDVLPSGWQTVIGSLDSVLYVSWLPSTASVWRRDVLQSHMFDEFYSGYSYLEDLDFSYGVSRTRKLAVVADACFFHYPSASGRVSWRQFGYVEVRNRIHFVRKYGLSLTHCRVGLLIRMMMSLLTGIVRFDRNALMRFRGNTDALCRHES